VATPGKNLWLLIRITALEWWTRFTGQTAWVDQVSDIGVGDRVVVDTDTITLTGTVLAVNSVKSQYFVQFANGTTGWYDSASVTLEYPRR
jgi:3-dehydroquinate synthase class II